MPRKRILSAFWVLTGVALVIFLIGGWTRRLEISDETPVYGVPRDHVLEDLWFRPDGTLVLVTRKPTATGVAEGIISIGILGIDDFAKGLPSMPALDLLKVQAPPDGSPRQIRYSIGARSLSPGDSAVVQDEAAQIVPYAVSADGTLIGAVLDQKLYVGKVSDWAESKVISHSLGDSGRVEALAFTAPESVTLIDQNGDIKYWDLAKGSPGNASTSMSQPVLIWSRGPQLLLTSATRDVCLQVESPNLKKNLSYGEINSGDVTAAALSRDGSHFAIGTRTGMVETYAVVSSGGVGSAFTYMATPKLLEVSEPVRAMAVLDDNRVLIGGKFPNIYLLEGNSTPRSVGSTQNAVFLMASHGEDLVFATPFNLVTAKIKDRCRLTDTANWVIGIYATLLSILAFFFPLPPKT